jgi:hypothetical protein
VYFCDRAVVSPSSVMNSFKLSPTVTATTGDVFKSKKPEVALGSPSFSLSSKVHTTVYSHFEVLKYLVNCLIKFYNLKDSHPSIARDGL